MLQYFADHPAKLKEKQERDKARAKGKKANMTDNAARRVASAWLRRAFNKFNAPELMGQLLTVLQKEGLKDAENQIRMKKIPQLVDKAWSSRDKQANEIRLAQSKKVAADIRALLTPLFQGLAPHVKDYRRFINVLASEYFMVGELPGIPVEWEVAGAPSVEDWGGGTLEGKLLYRQTLESPAEYEESEYSIPEKVGFSLKADLPLRKWPILFTKAVRQHVSDPKGFATAVTDLLGNSQAVAALGKLIIAGIKYQVRESGVFEVFETGLESVKEDLDDEVNSDNNGIDVTWEFDDAGKLGKAWFKATGQGLQLHVVGTLSASGSAELSEQDFDEPDDYDDDPHDYDEGNYFDSRYAALADHLTPKAAKLADKIAKTAKADVKPVRQRTQYTCMSTSMMMCLQALGHDITEDEVNRVMGARPMKGASWEQALAAAQHFGCRATLTMPSTVGQLREWTDQGIPIMIAWNPEGRDWSHASTVFDVTDDLPNPIPANATVISGAAEGGSWVWVADPNLPNPEKTTRIVSENDFYSKWYEKWPDYLVRRPACAIEREISASGQQRMAASRAPTPPKNLKRTAPHGHYQVWMTRKGENHPYITDHPSIQVALREAKKATTLGGVEQVVVYDSLGNQFKVVKSASSRGGAKLATTVRDNSGRTWGPKRGLEGPFLFKGRRVLYYDPREKGGTYYDPTTDMYLDHQEAARAVITAAGVTVKKLKDGSVVVNAGPSYQRDAKRLLEKAGWDWRLVENRAGSWILPKETVTSVDEVVKALSGVDAELRRSAMRVANAFRQRTAEPSDCYRDGLRGKELADCYMRFPDDLGPRDIALIQRYYPGWSGGGYGGGGYSRPQKAKLDEATKSTIAKNLVAYAIKGLKAQKGVKFLNSLLIKGNALSVKQQDWFSKIMRSNERYTRPMPDGFVVQPSYSVEVLFNATKSASSAKRWVEKNVGFTEAGAVWRLLGPPAAPAAAPPQTRTPKAPVEKAVVDSAVAEKVQILDALTDKVRNWPEGLAHVEKVKADYKAGRSPNPDDLKKIRNFLYKNRMRGEADHFRTAAERVAEMFLARAKKKNKPQSMKTRMKIDKSPVKRRNVVVKELIERGNSGGGSHKNKQDYNRGTARRPKHRKDMDDRAANQTAGYKGNPDGKDIYPNEVGHGYTEPMSGGHDIMRQLQNSLIHEQGDVVPQRPESPAVTRYSFDRTSLGESARRVAATWLTQQETN